MLAGRVSDPVLRLVQLWQDFQQAGIAVERLGDILNTPLEPHASEAGTVSRTTLPNITGQVTFEQVIFRYRADAPPVLQGLSFSVRPGTVIGIVGRSGSGKSTIAKLIQRLCIPESGRVMIDDIDVAQVDPAWLRRQIGVVLQENFLFSRSVRDNIALAEPGMAMERIVQAAKLAGAHEFILELPEGYDTLVGEHGCTLSGGQRQRLAIARALVGNPRILIFDEATSALDYESEAIIQRNLAHICRGRTVFLIAHRLSTVRAATLHRGHRQGMHCRAWDTRGTSGAPGLLCQVTRAPGWPSVRHSVREKGTYTMLIKRQRHTTPAKGQAWEFLPAVLEIEETPPSPVGRMVTWTIMAVFAAAFLWAAFGTIDIVATAQGKIIPSGHSKVIQPLESGVIHAIHVQNGQEVQEGQVLIELDTTANSADHDRLANELQAGGSTWRVCAPCWLGRTPCRLRQGPIQRSWQCRDNCCAINWTNIRRVWKWPNW